MTLTHWAIYDPHEPHLGPLDQCRVCNLPETVSYGLEETDSEVEAVNTCEPTASKTCEDAQLPTEET